MRPLDRLSEQLGISTNSVYASCGTNCGKHSASLAMKLIGPDPQNPPAARGSYDRSLLTSVAYGAMVKALEKDEADKACRRPWPSTSEMSCSTARDYVDCRGHPKKIYILPIRRSMTEYLLGASAIQVIRWRFRKAREYCRELISHLLEVHHIRRSHGRSLPLLRAAVRAGELLLSPSSSETPFQAHAGAYAGSTPAQSPEQALRLCCTPLDLVTICYRNPTQHPETT